LNKQKARTELEAYNGITVGVGHLQRRRSRAKAGRS
jgi:hypothetical protein